MAAAYGANGWMKSAAQRAHPIVRTADAPAPHGRSTRVAALRRGAGGGKWRLQLEGRGAPDGDAELAAARC